MWREYNDIGVVNLGRTTPPKTVTTIKEDQIEQLLFISISPRPKAVVAYVKEGRKKLKLRYNQLTLRKQYQFLCEYVNKVYSIIQMPDIDKGTCTFEIADEGDKHLHCHLIIQYKAPITRYDLATIRDQVRMNIKTIPHLCKGRDWMNNICKVTTSKHGKTNKERVERAIEYVLKDIDESHKHFPILIFDQS